MGRARRRGLSMPGFEPGSPARRPGAYPAEPPHSSGSAGWLVAFVRENSTPGSIINLHFFDSSPHGFRTLLSCAGASGLPS